MSVIGIIGIGIIMIGGGVFFGWLICHLLDKEFDQ